MELTAALASRLADLTAALDDPTVDLESTVRTLGRSARSTVDSFLGVTLTVVVDGYPFTITALDAASEATAIGTSLRVPVPGRGGEPELTPVAPAGTGELGSVVVFYAGAPGAFVDLAADITHAQRLPLDAVVLDADLQSPAPGLGLDELSTIHQAVGVLIARGHTPEAARVELERRAISGGVDVRTAAVVVVASTEPPPRS